MFKYLFIVLTFLYSQLAHSTAQQPDTIVIDGIELPLNTNPLDDLIEKKGWQPPEKASIWSSNWRGYIAKWKVVSGNLTLLDASILLKGYPIDDPKRKTIVPELFPENHNLVADWYSGALIVPDGEMTEYVHMGYGSEYSHYQILRVNKGVVIEHLSFTADQFEAYQHRKFQHFKESEKFRTEFDKLVKGKDKWLEEDAIHFLKNFYAEYYLSL
ncbi:hypothetical protein [Pseudoalteromonas ruthenica]|uniref:hypothetical protein n=1 Tax=Pseudoalteromonas ruthenica TaxID=151081 RepID=UPI00241BFBD8|nr:hypothetical protein [Pseudoalteromonas ruthenica]|tara:strand:- start:34980 stop:35621 length:642 start_codon:yes stop_codon:yes gene_type:complete